MPKKKRRSSALPRTILVLAVSALLLFLSAEAWRLVRSDQGRVALARWGLGGRDHVVALFAREIRAGLTAAGVPADSVRKRDSRGDPGAVRWRVGLRPEASLLQTNYAVSRRVEALGGVVLSGRETMGTHGETRLTLLLGLPKRSLHEVLLVRAVLPEESPERPAPRLALVLFGFGDDLAGARRIFDLPLPFAVALAPDTKTSSAMFRAAHEKGREVVLHIPLEPVNYPQLNPGPGTLLVTLKPDRATGTMRRWLDQAGPVLGVANHMGSLATQDMTLMGAVYRELRRRHLPFIHVQPAAGAVCRSLAAELGVSYDEPDAVLDVEARAKTPKALDRRWDEILEQARTREHAVVWVRVTPLTREWLRRATTAKRLGGVDLAPLSGVMRRVVVL
jgi:polysaccharide deacetylase 2 family uncharacterized protein YibQ